MIDETTLPRKSFGCLCFGSAGTATRCEVPFRYQHLLRSLTRAAKFTIAMTRQQVLDLYFMEARARLIDLGAFIDRMERATGEEDFRMNGFRSALSELSKDEPGKARRVLLSLSDPTKEPIPAATTKAACGAWPGPN